MTARRPRVLVVEDEELARERLARLMAEHPLFELAATCRNGADALGVLGAGGIDIVLLDIEMPGVGGMQVLERMGSLGVQTPLIVFITAHPRFAVDAFAGQAVDYLLKPFDGERLDKALQVALSRLQAREAVSIAERIRCVFDGVESTTTATSSDTGAIANRIVVRGQGRLLILQAGQIDWIEADGRYCVLHCGDKQHRTSGPLAKLAERLRSKCFVQISRSAMVNIDRIHELQEMFKGDLTAIMKGGEEIAISRRFRMQVLQRLGAH